MMNIQPEGADSGMEWAAAKLKSITIVSTEEDSIHIPSDFGRQTDMGMTREELEAHLKAQSSETKAALAEQNGAIEGRLAGFGARIDQSILAMEKDRERFEGDLVAMKGDIRADGRSTRTTMIVTAIASALAIVGGIAAFNATVLSNMVASFESGKNTMQSINDTTKRLEALQSRIEAQSSSIAGQQPAPPPK